MITIILPGYSVNNREWAYEVKEKLDLNHEVIVHEWQHWKEGSMSIPREVEKIRDLIRTNSFNICAKSVGTRVAMHLIPMVLNKLGKVILCGIPTRGDSEVTRVLYHSTLQLLGEKDIICLQNKADPFASFADIEKFIHKINPKITVIEKERSDHEYPYFGEFQAFLAG